MAVVVMVLGESGTGKSASLRNFKPENIGVFNVQKKPFPFRGGDKIRTVNTDDADKIAELLPQVAAKSIVIDDSQYILANQFMRMANVPGFQKFTDMAYAYWNLVQQAINLPNDRIVYFLQHIERDQNGNEKAKTIGKLLDEKITVEGLFTIVLKTQVVDGKYSFVTQNSGHDTVKSPMGMFPETTIDNDLALVDKTIREYYGMPAIDAKEKK